MVIELAMGLSLLAASAVEDPLLDSREVHLQEVRQLTFGGENAEAYWSPNGEQLVYQATAGSYACDQIFTLDPHDGEAEPQLVSTGTGRTTCAYFTAGGERILYASTHLADAACPARPDYSKGYVWPIYASYEIFSALPDGSDLRRLTDNDAYDAEATVCPQDGSVLFTSTRDGDLDLYRMDADGSDVRRLTDAPGYDGGAFFSADCSRIVWRASRPSGEALADYTALLEEGLVRPTELEIWVAEADGSEPRQVTYLGAASFAPYFFPSGERILFSSNVGDPRGREFDLWAVDVDGTDLEQVTFTDGFDGFPMFSPDGRWLAFASNRRQSRPGETNVFVARWIETPGDTEASAADRVAESIAWLADDAREGRGVGTDGLEEASRWLAERFAAIGLEAGMGGSYAQAFEVPVRVESGARTALSIDGEEVSREDFAPAAFSSSGEVAGEVVVAGYGVTAPELGHDDYGALDVEGRLVVVRRFTPPAPAFEDPDVERRYGDLRYKAWNAREHGAAGLLIVDLPEVGEGEELPEDAPFPALSVSFGGAAGLPVALLRRDLGARLLDGGHTAELVVELRTEEHEAENVVGRIGPAEAERGAVVVGAHYDHLGLGGHGSLSPDAHEPHNGADDNASGTAALLEIARRLVAERQDLARPVYLVAFSGEETGLLGSTTFTRQPPEGLDLEHVVAMLNLDMVGRLRRNRLSVLGAASAEEWGSLVPAACDRAGLGCQLGGDGYGPSDQTPFYAAGIPVLHFFTGAHDDYHKPSDDAARINAAGAAQIAGLVADLVVELASRDEPLTYVETDAPPPQQGDRRSYGASLGTVPDYVGDDRAGVLLAGARPGSPAEAAGLRRGDLLVELAGHTIGDIYDFVYILRQSKPGQTVTAVVVRDGERVELTVTFGESRGIR